MELGGTLGSSAVRVVVWGWLVLLGLDALALVLLGHSTIGSTSLVLLAVLAIGLVPLTALTPHAPARILLPTIAVVLWRVLGAMPLLLWTWDTPWAGRAEGLSQLLVCGGAAWVARALHHGGWSDRPALAGWRTLGIAAVGLGAGPPALALYTWGSLAAGLAALTGGYVGLDARGLYLTERSFERDGTTVHLVGMAHVGEASAYEALYQRFCGLGDAVVLTERQDTDRSQPSTRYGSLADALGLVEQPYVPDCGAQIRPADVLASAVPESTSAHIEAAWTAIERGEVVGTQLELDPAALEQAWHELVELRNQGLLHSLGEVLGTTEHVVIPWGGTHLPGIERWLLAEGWRPSAEARTTLIRYRSVAAHLL